MLAPGEGSGSRPGRESEREAAYRQLQAGLVVQYWACWIADLSAYLLRCAALWTRRRARDPSAPTVAGTQAVGALRGSAGSATDGWSDDWTARVDAHPDAVPGVRCLADVAFVRDLTSSLAISASYARQLQRALEAGRGGGQPEALLQAMRRLATVYQPIVSVLRAASSETEQTVADGDGLGGPWQAVHAGGSNPLSWQNLEAALGEAVTTQWANDTVEDVLGRARELGLMGTKVFMNGERGGAPRGALRRLRDEEVDAPSLANWAQGWEGGCLNVTSDAVEHRPSSHAIDVWWVPENDADDHDQRTMAREYSSRPHSDASGAFVVDALTGARLDWARQRSFASADGSVVTAELQPSALVLGSLSSWQAAWAVGCPVTGQSWRSIDPL